MAGPFAEHTIRRVTYDRADPAWTGHDTEYLHHDVRLEEPTVAGDGPWLAVDLPAGTQVTLRLGLNMNEHQPSYRDPWSGPVGRTWAEGRN